MNYSNEKRVILKKFNGFFKELKGGVHVFYEEI